MRRKTTMITPVPAISLKSPFVALPFEVCWRFSLMSVLNVFGPFSRSFFRAKPLRTLPTPSSSSSINSWGTLRRSHHSGLCMCKNNNGGMKNGQNIFQACSLGMYVTRVPQGPCVVVHAQPKRLRFLFTLRRIFKVLRYSAVVTSAIEQATVLFSNGDACHN